MKSFIDNDVTIFIISIPKSIIDFPKVIFLTKTLTIRYICPDLHSLKNFIYRNFESTFRFFLFSTCADTLSFLLQRNRILNYLHYQNNREKLLCGKFLTLERFMSIKGYQDFILLENVLQRQFMLLKEQHRTGSIKY